VSIYNDLRQDAKDPTTTGTAIQPYGAIACVEPYLAANPHFHVDVVTTKTCAEIHGRGW
jgi:hypothetical protein